MSKTAGGRSTPLAARLLALVIVPLLAVAFLATQRIGVERAAASDASDLVDTVELQQAVAAVLPPAQLERIMLSGLAAIDATGIPRDLVVGISGFDVESINGDNRADLERAFDTLTDEYRSLELSDGTLLGDRLGPIRGALLTQRDLSNERRATATDITRVFEQLDMLLAETLAVGNSSTEAATSFDRHRTQLNALADVLVSAGQRAQLLIDGIFSLNPDGVEPARVAARHDTYIEVFVDTLEPDERALFDQMLAESSVGGAAVISEGATPGSIAADPTAIRDISATVNGEIIYLAALEDYSNGFHERVASQVRRASNDAASKAQQTVLLLWTIAAFTLGLIVLVLWSILAPLRRLTDRAVALSEGEIELPPLDVKGPRDFRSLTSTMNDMVSTLDRVNQRIRKLASGGVDDPSSEHTLPGAIGVSLRESVQHLASVTAQLHRSEALSSAIVTQADDAIWTTDEHGIVLTANTASRRLTGLGTDKQCGMPIGEILSQTDGEALVLTRSGVQPKVLVARSVIDAGDDRVTAVIAHDISERSRFEDRLAYQASHDALTGLPNRFAVLEHLAEMGREHPGQIAVLYMDLDGFKSINDVRGHSVGDRVLSDVATRLQRAVRNGEFVGRLGGDEFVVITHRFAQVADVIALGHRIIREVEMPLDYESNLFSISASIGVALPAAGTAPLEMIGQADNAVYQAKDRGRGCVELFDVAMQEEIDREAELEEALRKAVRNDELIIHLQPMTDVKTNCVRGAEALVRWMRPGHGMVMPGGFIPIAERSSLILEIERWVLTRACERLAEWKRREPECQRRIAVNISGRHLADGDLLADIDAVLEMTGADPTMLELELTESRLLEDMERTKTVFTELRARGITIAIDDFGTGYASMTYLRELPIDSIKIDRSFVALATEHGYDSTVIEALLTIGRTLNLAVVAEGVETEEQLDYVRARGCDLAQGFLLARPMPIEDAEAYIFGAAEVAVRPAAMQA